MLNFQENEAKNIADQNKFTRARGTAKAGAVSGDASDFKAADKYCGVRAQDEAQ